MGVLQSCEGEVTRSSYHVKTTYTFQSPQGVTISGEQSDSCNHLRGRPLPQVNSIVAVLYVNDRFHRML